MRTLSRWSFGAMAGALLAPVLAVMAGSPASATAVTELVPTADTYSQYAAPTATAGTSGIFSVDGRSSGLRRAYLKFAVPATPTGYSVTKATLKLYVENNGQSAGPGPVLYTTSTGWTETGLTWSNQPALGAKIAVTSAPYAAGSWVTWDVTAGLSSTLKTAGGTYALALTTAEKKWLGFRSRESRYAPVLTVTTNAPAPPTSAAARYGWGTATGGDEFSYSGAPNSTKWSVFQSAGHDGNGLRAASAWNVNGSTATVTGSSSGTTGGMSARFDRRTHGRWEVRMRTSARDPKYHPVVMLWPDAGSGTTCPEIDFAEGLADTTNLYFFNHYGCNGVQTWTRRALDTTQWHNYAVEWTPRGVVGYVDGVEWFRDTTHVPTGSMHLAIQLDWFPDGTATKASWMQIDWARLYPAP